MPTATELFVETHRERLLEELKEFIRILRMDRKLDLIEFRVAIPATAPPADK